MAITTAAPRLGTSAFSDVSPLELRPNATPRDIEAIILAVYQQVLGNPHLLKSERLVIPESLLRDRSITVQEFVRLVAKSELYKQKFFYNNFQSRTIELNFKHLLGRAPYDQSEITEHLNLYQSKGFDGDIDSYINSPEYQAYFGENIVPYYRDLETTGVGQRAVGFPRLLQLYRGFANSSSAQLIGGAPRLVKDLARNTASTVVPPSGGAGGFAFQPALKGDASYSAFGGSKAFGSGRLFRVEVAAISGPGYPKVRRVNKAVIIPYEELTPHMQRVQRQGGKIASITPL
ncbi:phycobilisome linker polypeptide [Aetokthonos hydrillicola Thurmond2011]|uniref:Phycobilisome linker polypeptide n=1 Tax=Aetokthonos hydrillicola Thurmond2011 TaxID=2712845 RepID=A0AAP5MAJ5_9CYAN|nr:phycobilisome linker polypeptide [Aetokthonos hydrillicola]MBO3462385.1 photosystem I reaction center subunit XII [Aetokthonos hydrillicola CCALA 1050]MBW4590388.1 phycobilisome linker polypeptide [Aetokthonos hydrillicola CCALA 1050]MDR9898190.1 phycobilisome linker polypeptide [Aetokthonos hydrillicola Thurmond2011]